MQHARTYRIGSYAHRTFLVDGEEDERPLDLWPVGLGPSPAGRGGEVLSKVRESRQDRPRPTELDVLLQSEGELERVLRERGTMSG